MEVVQLDALLVVPGDCTQTPDTKRVADLAESIREIGLISPVIVTPGKTYRNGTRIDAWKILAGLHRYEAMSRNLGWETIPCIVTDVDGLKAELLTIDENLVRRELSDAERAWQTKRRKEIYEALHPEAVNGAGTGGRSGRTKDDFAKLAKSNGLPAERFTASTAKVTGRSERTIQREAERGEKLGPVLNRIAGTSLDKGVEIDALADMPAQEREEIVARAEKGEQVSARKVTVVTTVQEPEPQVVKVTVKHDIMIPPDPLAAARVLARSFTVEELGMLIAALLKAQNGEAA